MGNFERRTLRINGIDTVLLEGGSGPTLVYFHGAGTVTGFDFANAWAKKFRVLIPFHPGFGASADDPAIISDIHDYVLHYIELFDQLGLARFKLVGQSMGGYIATKFAIEHRGLVEKLALVCPIGVPTAEPTADFLKTPPEQLPALLAFDPQTVIKHLPKGEPSAEFVAERVKEAVTAGRVLASGTFDARLPRHMHRMTMPTMLIWGNNDKVTPPAQHKAWMRALPRATIRLFDDAGHVVLDEAPAAVTAIGEFFGTR